MTHAYILVFATVAFLVLNWLLASFSRGQVALPRVGRKPVVLRDPLGEFAGQPPKVLQTEEPPQATGEEELVEIDAEGNVRLPGEAPSSIPVASRTRSWVSLLRPLMSILVTLVLLLCALFMVMSGRYPKEAQHFAYGVIGTIIGYWLRPEGGR